MELIRNKRAYFDYEIIDTLEAGIELFGHEVKSLKGGRGSLDGAYVIVRPSTKLGINGNEAFLVNMHVPPYQPKNVPAEYDPYRARKLLLHKKELAALIGSEKQSGLTVIPLLVYTKGGKIKVEISVARGRKKHDKREVIKKREAERDIGRTLKYQ